MELEGLEGKIPDEAGNLISPVGWKVSNARKRACVAWGTQSTMDYKVRLTADELNSVVEYIMAKPYISDKDKEVLRKIREKGLEKDTELPSKIAGEVLKKEIESILERQCRLALLNNKECREELGGSPAISAKVGFLLYRNIPALNSAKVIYFGTYPKSVQEHAKQKEPELEELFATSVRNDKLPATLSFECGDYKLMLANSEGRELKDLEEKVNLPEIYDRNLMVAIGGLNKGKPKDYMSLVRQIKKSRENAYIFIGTNSFEGDMNKREFDRMDGYFHILREADIVSMNEAELDQLHENLYGRRNISRAEKLEQLNLGGITIVHSAVGVMYHIGTGIKDDAKGVIEDMLKLAIDATSYYYEKGECFSQICQLENYRADLKRNKVDLHSMFGNCASILRMGYIPAPYVNRENAKGSITGLGATLDGYISPLMAPVFHHLIKWG